MTWHADVAPILNIDDRNPPFSLVSFLAATLFDSKSHLATGPSTSVTFPGAVSTMKHIAAYLLLQLGGNASPSAADITTLLEAGGVEVEQERAEKLVAELEGKDINEVSFERREASTGGCRARGDGGERGKEGFCHSSSLGSVQQLF